MRKDRPTAVATTPADATSLDALTQQGRDLLQQATAGSGSVSKALAQYRGHNTLLNARTKSGGAEVHAHFADFIIVLDGEGTELTGGTVVDAKPQANGETRGTRLDGATAHVLHKGDVLHIPAGTPHQAIEDTGQGIVVYVIKVQEP